MASGLAVAGLPRVVDMLKGEGGNEILNLLDALCDLLGAPTPEDAGPDGSSGQ